MGDVVKNPDQIMYANVWDGGAKNMLPYPSVTITCTVAPTASRAILGGPNGSTQQAVSALLDKGNGTTPTIVNAITVVGDYSPLNGQKWFSLAAGDGTGTFFISGGQ